MPLLDDATIRELLRTDYGRLVNAVALVSGSFAAAEDAVQEAIVRAWTSRESIESPAAWVAVVAMNLSAAHGGERSPSGRRVSVWARPLPVPQARSTTEWTWPALLPRFLVASGGRGGRDLRERSPRPDHTASRAGQGFLADPY